MDHEDRIVEFDRLNLLGKAVFLTGQVAKLAGTAIEYTVDQAVSIIEQAEKAFSEEMDSSVEDAKILEEHVVEKRSRSKHSSRNAATKSGAGRPRPS